MLTPMRAVDTEQAGSRICCGCGLLLPVESFRLRSAGGRYRQSRCRSCLARYQREYRAAKRTDRMAEFAAQVRRQRTTAGVLSGTAQLSQTIGGPHGFALAFKTCLDACPPGSRRAVNMLAAFLRLMEACQPPPLDQLTDADLGAE